jgi:hypothetical protein
MISSQNYLLYAKLKAEKNSKLTSICFEEVSHMIIAGYHKRGNGLSNSKVGREFLDQLSDYWLMKKAFM